jgi:Holliday junction resolvase RusA-like endonuclease
LEFVVPGEPVPAARPRVVPRYSGKKGGPRRLITDGAGRPILSAYTEKETEEYEQRVAAFARAALQAHPEWLMVAMSDARFLVHLYFFRSPKNRGDKDNYEKAALDGIKKVNQYREEPPKKPGGRSTKIFLSGVFRDDARVTQGIVALNTITRGEPRTEICVEPAIEQLAEPLWMRVAIERGWRPPASAPRFEPDAAMRVELEHRSRIEAARKFALGQPAGPIVGPGATRS